MLVAVAAARAAQPEGGRDQEHPGATFAGLLLELALCHPSGGDVTPSTVTMACPTPCPGYRDIPSTA